MTRKYPRKIPYGQSLDRKAKFEMEAPGNPLPQPSFPTMSSSSEDMPQATSSKTVKEHNSCTSRRESVNYARNYDDVDDVIEMPRDTSGKKQSVDSSYSPGSVVSPRKQISAVTNDVNPAVDQGWSHVLPFEVDDTQIVFSKLF